MVGAHGWRTGLQRGCVRKAKQYIGKRISAASAGERKQSPPIVDRRINRVRSAQIRAKLQEWWPLVYETVSMNW